MIPTYEELELPILRVVEKLGGKAKPAQVYEALRKLFPDMTDADLLETLPSGDNKFRNRVRWVRQALVERAEMDRAGYGVWALTVRGKARLQGQPLVEPHSTVKEISQNPANPPLLHQGPVVNLEELADNYLAAFERKVLQELLDLEPAAFERFAVELMKKYGFQRMQVTNRITGPDGGIDGFGEIKVGLALMRAAFQCKRWQGTVGRPDVDKFRGAIQGQFEHGYFFTTSRFSADARQASIRNGAVPVFLFGGHEIVQIMIEKGLGVVRRPIEIYEDRIETLFENE